MLDDRYLGKVSRRLYVALAKTLCNLAFLGILYNLSQSLTSTADALRLQVD